MALLPQYITGYARISNIDPTRTLSLRAAFARDMDRRFIKIRQLIVRAVAEEDCFALSERTGYSILQELYTPGRHAFNFPRSDEKVRAFMRWLGRMEDLGILEVTHALQPGEGVEEAWTNLYIQSAYQKGIARAREELIKKQNRQRRAARAIRIPSIEESGGISVVFNGPFHADKVGLIYTRTFSDLQGITNAMDQQISKVLAQGIADGRNPRELARMLVKTISGPFKDLGITDAAGRFIPAQRRAQMLARTEVIRAHNVATIQEYRNWGIVGVKIKAEWSTADDSRVCPRCADLEGKIFTLDEIERMIPLHPLCRCYPLPVDQTDIKTHRLLLAA